MPQDYPRRHHAGNWPIASTDDAGQAVIRDYQALVAELARNLTEWREQLDLPGRARRDRRPADPRLDPRDPLHSPAGRGNHGHD